ncbi:MAG: Gfo/Idh/MocA family oxidoreductase [Myxacorys californica WJT36-NPBG1]|jgi:predicted dehydrogenase|nr:Gfo/Idh/MocA family oxidoreductase [Myxacorys californica WJT36-NPBG1]
MKKPTRIAVFGVGRWGTHLLRNFLEHAEAEVVAVVDPCAEQLAIAAQRFELDDRVFVTTQWQDALELSGLEAVAIATPAKTHYALITAALKQGLHVLAEKPLTLSTAESVQLCRLAAEQHRQLVVDHTYLFHPAVLQGRGLVESLGDLRYAYAARTHLSPVRQDVDALWDLAIHDIAILNYWLTQTPCEVQARGQVWLQPNALPCESSNLFPNGLADTVWATLIYPSGFQATLHLSWLNSDKQRRMCLVGEQGSLIFDELAAEPLMIQWGQFERQGNRFRPVHQRQEAIKLSSGEPLNQVCEHFLACVRCNQPSDISPGWLGAELVQILVALSESMQQGGRVMGLAKL